MLYLQFKKLLSIAVLFWGLGTLASAHDNSPHSIFVDNAYQPYMYSVNNLEADGLYPRIIAEALTLSGYQAEITALPWKRAILFAESGKGAVGGAYKNDERQKMFDYSDPLYEERLVLFVNKNKQFDFNSLADLKGKVLGVNRGWSYGQGFDAAREQKLFDVVVRNNHVDNFKMLELGRIDGVVLDQTAGEVYLSSLDIQDSIVALPKPVSINNGYLIIAKRLNMTAFLDDFNQALKRLRKEGKFDDIVQRYMEDTLSK